MLLIEIYIYKQLFIAVFGNFQKNRFYKFSIFLENLSILGPGQSNFLFCFVLSILFICLREREHEKGGRGRERRGRSRLPTEQGAQRGAGSPGSQPEPKADAQSVECLTLDFSSGHDLGVMKWREPCMSLPLSGKSG